MANVPLTTRPPLPPFTRESAIQKVRLAEDGWNTRDPEKVALAYAIDSRWRNRSEFITGPTEAHMRQTPFYAVQLEGGGRINARAMIIASGARYRKPAIANASQFEGAGVYYAA